jgi:ketosteroid isomerase-like protein
MTMRVALAVFALLASVPAAAAEPPRWEVSAAERPAIEAVIERFRLAIIAKDGPALSDLLINSRIVFNQLANQAGIDETRKTDRHYDGLGNSGFSGFARAVTGAKVPIEERFYNVRIEQDGPLALVTFDFDYLEDGKVENRGLEHWMLRKIDGTWKIFSVVWTSRGN